jgi:DNA-binding PucR family transcriptional regulator
MRSDLSASRALLLPSIDQLLQSDRRHQVALVQSLASLLENDWNVSTLARLLDIHRHTLLNCVERIEDILGLQMNQMPRLDLRLQLIGWHLAGSPTN